jgi:hypothetical protein
VSLSEAAAAAEEGAAGSTEPSLWHSTLARLAGLNTRLDPFLALDIWDRRPTIRAVTHIAILLRLAAVEPRTDHSTLGSFTAFLSEFMRDSRLQGLLDRKVGELPYFLWLADLLRDDGAADLTAVLASRLRHPHALMVERTAYGRFLLAWHLRVLQLGPVIELSAAPADELAPFRRLARLRAGLDDALEVFELSVLTAGARARGADWQRALTAAPPLDGLDELVEQALAVLVRGEEAVPLAAMLASAHLLDTAPLALRRLAYRRLSTLWLRRLQETERPAAPHVPSGGGSTGTIVAIAMRLAETAS